MVGRLSGAGVIACLAIAASVEAGQSRYEAIDHSAVAGVSGLRIINIRDNLLRTCYAVFLSDSTDSADVASRSRQRHVAVSIVGRDS